MLHKYNLLRNPPYECYYYYFMASICDTYCNDRLAKLRKITSILSRMLDSKSPNILSETNEFSHMGL